MSSNASPQPGDVYLAFNGLDVQVVTNIVNNAGASLTGTGNSVNQLDKVIKLSRFQGGTPTHIFCSFGMQIQINQILDETLRLSPPVLGFDRIREVGFEPAYGDID